MPTDLAARLALLESAVDSLGVYPKSINGVDRTPWQDGWNAALIAITDKVEELSDWFDALPLDTQSAIARLLESGAIHLNDDGEWDDRMESLPLNPGEIARSHP